MKKFISEVQEVLVHSHEIEAENEDDGMVRIRAGKRQPEEASFEYSHTLDGELGIVGENQERRP